MSEMGVAHAHQLFKVPDGVADENATLSDPLSTCLHMVINTPLRGDETVLVFGCGAMGLCTIAALRALQPGRAHPGGRDRPLPLRGRQGHGG